MSERLRRGISIDVCRQCKVPAVSCVRTQNGMYITTGVHHHMQITNCTETWNIQRIFHISCGRIGVGQTCVAGSVRSWPQILGLHSIHSGCCTAQGTHCSIYSDAAAHHPINSARNFMRRWKHFSIWHFASIIQKKKCAHILHTIELFLIKCSAF